jgi:hypothetical protein
LETRLAPSCSAFISKVTCDDANDGIELRTGTLYTYVYDNGVYCGALVPGNAIINGGGGQNSLYVNDAAHSGDGLYFISMSPTPRITANNLNFQYANIGWGLRLDAGVGDSTSHDYIDIDGTPYSAIATTVNGGLGDDYINVTPGSHNLDNLGADVVINGGAGSDSLDVWDDYSTSSNSYEVGSNYVYRSFGATAGYFGVENVGLYAGNGNDGIAVVATSFGTTTTVDGGGGNDLFGITAPSGNLGALAGALTVGGGLGNDSVALYDTADANDDGYTITYGSVTRSGVLPISYDSMEALAVNAGSGNNYVAVVSTAAGTATTVNGGDGNEVVDANLAGLGGALTVNGGAGGDAAVVDDSLNPNDDSYTLAATGVTRTGAMPVTVNGVEGLSLYAGSGNNSIVVDSVPTGGTSSVDAGGGRDNISVTPQGGLNALGGTLSISGGTGVNDSLAIYDDADVASDTYTVTASSIERTGAAVVNYGGIESLALDAGSGDNTVNVFGTPAGASTAVNAGPGNDTTYVADQTSQLSSLGGPLAVNGQGGADSLTVYDNASSDAGSYDLTATTLARSGAPTVSYSGQESVAVFAGSGNNSIAVDGTAFGVPTVIDGGSGNDTVGVTQACHDLACLGGDLTVAGGAGSDGLAVYDQNDDVLDPYTVTATSVTRPHTHAVYYASVEALTLACSYSQDNPINVESTAAGATTTVNAGYSNNAVAVTPTSQNLASLGGPLTVNGQGGTDSLTVHDEQNSANDSYWIQSNGLGRTNVGTIAFSGLEGIALDAGSGANAINIYGTPAGATASVNAGPGDDGTYVAGLTGQLSSLGGPLAVSGDAGTDSLWVYDTSSSDAGSYTLTSTTLSRSGAPTISYSGQDSVTLLAGSGNTSMAIEGTAAGATTTIDAGYGSSAIAVTPTSQNLANLGGPLTIDGQGGTDSLVVHDEANVSGTYYYVRSTTLARDKVPTITYQGVESFTVDAGSIANGINVFSTAAGTATTVDAGGGNDSVLAAASGFLSNLAGPLTVLGGAGSDFLSLSDIYDSANDTYGLAGQTLSRNGLLMVTMGGFEQQTLVTGSGANVINVESIPAGLPTTVNAGGGNDTLVAGGVTGKLDGLLGPLTLNGQAGADAVVVNDANSATNNVYVGAPTTVTKLGGPVITYGTAEAVTVTGGGGRDLLIAGATPMKLVGNGGDDIVVGGTTQYDTDATALNALMAEWARTDESYRLRVLHVTRGGGANGAYKLNAATVVSNGGGNTLLGGAQQDLFFAKIGPDTTDYDPATETLVGL